ncbi:hypothetical protein CDD82_4599 [Ophiocordyceps australis]|uniref:Threonylcarbamoyl-AMP synthase n=1 Tax=Ophiocordyceps australis TaxID=1399860 RepID=A0A2C5Z246_9HYPO|nr:hypothetical protein CDD82_4599 [Ophiocordyceps australis]
MKTRIVGVTSEGLGHFVNGLKTWAVDTGAAAGILHEAASQLRQGEVPVGFPTETVYGLGADATRGRAVEGIYRAKGRPADNPLIVHVADLDMLGDLLGGERDEEEEGMSGEDGKTSIKSRIPPRYLDLIQRFWPGPLTVLLPIPPPDSHARLRLAPQVTAGLPTFGVRMPASPLALTLIKLAGVPLAAPSANASTRPSPTTAQHVRDDLAGRIGLVLDGGACSVGVESTVVDGLCEPPVVLRPGGISIDEIRKCRGWHHVVPAYRDESEEALLPPRAPGMKYKHYSPKARVVLLEASCRDADEGVVAAAHGHVASCLAAGGSKIGVIRTRRWKPGAGLVSGSVVQEAAVVHPDNDGDNDATLLHLAAPIEVLSGRMLDAQGNIIGQVYDINLGADTRSIAHGLFAALRELDVRGADMILVDGIDDEHDVAAAVMNRLRKAASETRR